MDMLASMRILKLKRTIGDSLKTEHELRIHEKRGDDAWGFLVFKNRGEGISLQSNQQQLVPISMSDKNKEEWKVLYDYLDKKLESIQVKRALKNSVLGPGKTIIIQTYLDVSDTITDGVAEEVLKLLKTGNDFGKIKMDKYGSSVSSDKRITHEIEREEEFPEAPNKDEASEVWDKDEISGVATVNRWKNPPTEEDKKKYGWKKILESTKPGLSNTKDWTFVSYNLEQTVNVDFDKTSYPDIASKERTIKNIVVGHYGKEPVMVAGLIAKWNLGSEKQQAKVNPLVDESVLNWRKW